MTQTDTLPRGANSLRTQPDDRGHFGQFGGRYVAETLMPLIHELDAAYAAAKAAAETWALAQDKPNGKTTFLKKYAAFTLLVLDEWLLDPPDEGMRSMLLELLERRYGHASTVFCTQYAQKDWHQRLGSGVHADAIMDRIVHNTLWIETGTFNMREHTAVN